MPIVNPKILTERIPFSDDGYVEVRGIGFIEISQLIDANYDKLAPFFDRITGKDTSRPLTMENVGEVPRELLVSMPVAVAHLIALAADAQPEQMDFIRKLPADVQLLSLEAIMKLTVRAAGGGIPFVEMLTRMLASVNNLQNDVSQRTNQALSNGTKGSRTNAAS